jgi:hypothetical protein
MNLLPFSIDEVNAITRLAQVDKYMRRNCAIVSRVYDVPNLGGHSVDASKIYVDRGLPKWQWIGQQVGVSRFVILREKYTSSLIDALRELEGRELSELLVRMRMVNKDDSPVEHSYSVGMGAVIYAVKLQYSENGFRSFEHFLEREGKSTDQCVNLPPDLRRVP